MKRCSLVLVPYPFSDFTQEKIRPVLVISSNAYNSKFKDAIVVPLTTNLSRDDYSVILKQENMASGELLKTSLIKAHRVFSINQSLFIKKIGDVEQEICNKVANILTRIVAPHSD